MVPVQDIRDNNYDLSINRYKEVVYEQKTYEKPDVIIAQIEQLDEERQSLLQELKEMLATDFLTEKEESNEVG
jgi:type I restriction enzyme M protein